MSLNCVNKPGKAKMSPLPRPPNLQTKDVSQNTASQQVCVLFSFLRHFHVLVIITELNRFTGSSLLLQKHHANTCSLTLNSVGFRRCVRDAELTVHSAVMSGGVRWWWGGLFINETPLWLHYDSSVLNTHNLPLLCKASLCPAECVSSSTWEMSALSIYFIFYIVAKHITASDSELSLSQSMICFPTYLC